jgi:hypothetical protein
MTARPARFETPAAALADEILQEKAAALGRLGRALEIALMRLAEFDTAHAGETTSAAEQHQRRTLLREAGHALWCLVVQRECCGLRNTVQFMREYRVPADVQRVMGAFPPPGAR